MLRISKRALPLMLLMCGSVQAGGGPFGIDHEWSYDQSGIWARNYQVDLEHGVLVAELAGALWFGNDQPIGHTFWQTIDSSAVSGLGAAVLKSVFTRTRPNQGDNPNQWFQGHSYESFPSGETTLQASFVTPFIVDFAKAHPWVWSLELLPLYDGIARMKAQAHWQTDVIAGWALGSGIGYWTASFKTPIFVRVLPRGVTVGLAKQF